MTERKLVTWFLTFNNPNTFLLAILGPCSSELDVTEYLYPVESPQVAVC
jgi:hypothetical protein